MQGGGTRSGPLEVTGYQFQAGETRQLREYSVGSGYFSASGIPLRLGRAFDSREAAGPKPVAIVNEEFVRHYLGNRDPIGLRYGIGKPPTFYEIVGVASDAKYNDLREEVVPMAYYPWSQQMPIRLFSVIVRTRGDSTAIAPALRRALLEVHPDLYTDLRTLFSEIDNTLIRERLLASLSGFFGLLAVVHACLGWYGVTAFGVTRRTGEIGVRMALGAMPFDVIRLVMRETLLLASVGIAPGVPLALWVSRLASAFLFGLRPGDPLVVAAGAGVLLVVCATAGWLPARRAARIDPMIALRWE
jgi:predicted permease